MPTSHHEPFSTTSLDNHYASASNVLIIDHYPGSSSFSYCDDMQIDALLTPSTSPIVRVILLHTGLTDENALASQGRQIGKGEHHPEEGHAMLEDKNKMNITKHGLEKLVKFYDLAPVTSAQLRGHGKAFGARSTWDENQERSTHEFWYTIRARDYVWADNSFHEEDLKLSVVTRYDIKARSTVFFLVYKPCKYLPVRLWTELLDRLKEYHSLEAQSILLHNPFSWSLFVFDTVIQFYAGASRSLREMVVSEEQKVHGSVREIRRVVVPQLHNAMCSLDQDCLHLTMMLRVLKHLRQHHAYFCKKAHDIRDSLFVPVEEELGNYEAQVVERNACVDDISKRVQALLNLAFNLSSRNMAEDAMHENAAMKAIAILTMLFLPTSLVAGILGSNVFAGPSRPSDDSDYGAPSTDQSALYASSQWWLLPVVSIPLTLLTFFAWYLWKPRISNERQERAWARGYAPQESV